MVVSFSGAVRAGEQQYDPVMSAQHARRREDDTPAGAEMGFDDGIHRVVVDVAHVDLG
jgi:hypothetical protein